MALKSANQAIRWLQRIGSLVAVAVLFILDVLKSFFNIKTDDQSFVKGVKVADRAIRLPAYIAMDYGLWFVSVAIFTTMKTLGFSFPWIFAVLWAYDFVVAGAFVLFYEKTGKDLSLGEDFRRATDTIHGRSRWAGYMAMAPIVVRGIFWTGPEKIITFFRKEIGTTSLIIAVLLVLTAFQALLWAILYDLGYGLVAG